MKKYLLTFSLLALIGMINVNSQSTLIIEENFQGWEATEDTNPDTCSIGVVIEDSITRFLTLQVINGTAQIPVTLIKCGVAPECESRRIEDGGASENLPGVTTGWILLNKLNGYTVENFQESPDTIGEFIFGPIPQIDSIRFAHSATGSARGIRIYTSTDGITWERPVTDEFWDGDDSQLGDVNSVEIMKTDVYIKFTSGFKQSDQTSQYTRLHNFSVWGIPGEVQVGIGKKPNNIFNIYPIIGTDLFRIEGDYSSVSVYNTLGKLIYKNNSKNQCIDLSGKANGIYIVKAENIYGHSCVKKVVKQ